MLKCTNHLVDALKVSPPALLASITGFWMPALFGDVLEPTHIRNNILYRHIAMYLTVLSNGRRRNRSPTYLQSPQSRGIAVLGEFNFDFIFFFIFSSLHFIQRKTTDSSMPGTSPACRMASFIPAISADLQFEMAPFHCHCPVLTATTPPEYRTMRIRHNVMTATSQRHLLLIPSPMPIRYFCLHSSGAYTKQRPL